MNPTITEQMVYDASDDAAMRSMRRAHRKHWTGDDWDAGVVAFNALADAMPLSERPTNWGPNSRGEWGTKS